MEVLRIKNDYREGVISDSVARERIVVLQNRNRKMLQAPGTLGLKPKRLD